MSIAIRFTDVCKEFRLRQQRPFIARELLRVIMQRPSAVEVHHALRDVSFEVQAGESVGVVGRNGAGKSTLLNVLGLLDLPDTGNYHLNGIDVAFVFKPGAKYTTRPPALSAPS